MNWQEKYALIIDEVGILGARMLYAVNVQLRRLRESTEDFGDIPVIIFFGDFHQFRPVQEWSILLPSSSFPRGQGHGFGLEQQRQHDVAYALWRKFTVVVLKKKSSCRARSTTTQTHNACSAGSPGSVGCRVSEQQLLSRGETHSMGVGYRSGDATQRELMEPECRGNTHVPEAATCPSPHLRFRA